MRTPVRAENPTILVVEDNADALEALAQILDYEGYSVATAYEGREALEYLERHPVPSLILLDLMMPGMNGWEFRAELTKFPAFANVPIVVMTALADSAEIVADCVVSKPIDLKRLLRIMKDLLSEPANSDEPASTT